MEQLCKYFDEYVPDNPKSGKNKHSFKYLMCPVKPEIHDFVLNLNLIFILKTLY